MVHISERGGKKKSSPGGEFLITPLLPHLLHKFQIKQQETFFRLSSYIPPSVIIHSQNRYFEVSTRKIGLMNTGWAGKNYAISGWAFLWVRPCYIHIHTASTKLSMTIIIKLVRQNFYAPSSSSYWLPKYSIRCVLHISSTDSSEI